MRISILKHIRQAVFAGIVCLAVSMVLSSCSKTPKHALLGKWQFQDQPVTVDFRPDGTVVTTGNGKESSAGYKFLNETNIEMETIAMNGTNKLSVSVKLAVAVKGDTADLTMAVPQQGGAPPTPFTLHLKRAK